MSRHTLPAIDAENHIVVVGYDRPLDDFFATVYRRRSADLDEDIILWIAGTRDLADLRRRLAPYAVLSEAVANELLGERINRASHPMMKIVDHRPPP